MRAAYARYVERMGRQPGPVLDDYGKRIADRQAWVLLAEAECIAGVLVLEEQADALLLDNVAVDPDFHGRGLGRRLILHAEEEARRRGFATLRLYTHEVMTESQELYRRNGWRIVDRRREKGYDRIYMEKPVA